MPLFLQYGDTPLMVASGGGHDGCVQLLLDRGAQIEHQNTVSAFRDQPSVSLYYVLLCEEGIVCDVCGECWVCESFYTFSSKRWTPCCSFMFKTFMIVCLYIRGARMKFFVLTLNGLQDTGR